MFWRHRNLRGAPRGWHPVRPRRATSSTMSAALALGAAVPISMMASRRAKASIWRAPRGRVGEQRKQRPGQPFRRAGPPAGIPGTIFSPITRLARMTAAAALIMRRARMASSTTDAIGRDSRHAGEREFERHRAGRRQRRARDPERRPFLAGSTTMRGCTAQPAVPARPGRRDAGPSAARAPRRQRACATISIVAPKIREQAPHLAAAAAGQHQKDRRIGIAAARLLGVGPQLADVLDQRMADIGAGRSAEPRMHGRLERQEREHMIDIGAHRARPPGRQAQTEGET